MKKLGKFLKAAFLLVVGFVLLVIAIIAFVVTEIACFAWATVMFLATRRRRKKNGTFQQFLCLNSHSIGEYYRRLAEH